MAWEITAGPRKSKKVIEMIRDLSRECQTYVEIYGTIGDPASEMRTAFYSPFGGCCNEAARAEVIALGERHGHVISNDNLRAVEADVTAALEKARAGRPVKDSRRASA